MQGPMRALFLPHREWLLLPLVLFVLFIAPSSSLARGGHSAVQNFYRVRVKTTEDYNRILQLGVMVILSKQGEYVDIVAPASIAEKLQDDGEAVELVQRDIEGSIERMRSRPGMGAFHTYAEMDQELRELASRHPDLVSVESIGPSWEGQRRRANRQLLAVKVCDGVRTPQDKRPEVLYFAGIHARELATTEVLLQLINYLVERRGRDAQVDYLLSHRQLWFVPLLNPDGREYCLHTDIWWRKNRHALGSSGAVGVDLNRNFGFHWGDDEAGAGSSADPYSAIYRGDHPFSEPEVANFCRFVKSHQFAASIAYHSYGSYLLFPYGFTSTPAEDRSTYDELGADMTRYNRYQFGDVRSMVGYYSSGRHDDWLYGDRQDKVKTLAMEIELGRSFFPEESDLGRLFQDVLHTNMVLARRAGVDIVPTGNFGAGKRVLTIAVVNKGIRTAENVAVTVLGGSLRKGTETRRVARLAGLLERSRTADKATFTFALHDTASGAPPEDSAGLKLRLSFVDGAPVVMEYPISLPAD
jgi:hypothetical protein